MSAIIAMSGTITIDGTRLTCMTIIMAFAAATIIITAAVVVLVHILCINLGNLTQSDSKSNRLSLERLQNGNFSIYTNVGKVERYTRGSNDY